MAAKKKVEAVEEVVAENATTVVEESKEEKKVNDVKDFKNNLIGLGNVLIKQVTDKQVQDPTGTIGRIVEIYNAVK